ncbi:hypothetical protein PFICI_15142 [Pestalotiopsis fici W106-1]|uniref:Uncharacterized protein n=1 Tax=Pestalotiopsis fici (strain W106-1 / CGMCC3.15140) TaxID=1229662 RepID=W3WJ74_PESFW|nr:uncharacterized protein PFICI_15142 [Pestalotiopsis fici W106-1]ETS73197.1 hypothetical protein PFICI_15142 [Pestalotiopsis fici W106-1]
MTVDLKSTLNSELFEFMRDKWIPFSRTQSLDFDKVIPTILSYKKLDLEQVQHKALPALKGLSLFGLNHLPDMLEFLPDPDNADFPSEALGLQLLLDQAPRALLKGIDSRWSHAYFDEISLQYAQRLQTLPAHQKPSSWGRWQGKVSLDYFVLVRIWFGAPFVHHEKASAQAVAFTEQTRRLIEDTFKIQDPCRTQPEKRWDLYGFPRLWKQGGPESPCGVAAGTFWLTHLMDVHKPILDLYGRYPYQNSLLGRLDTAEEEAWLQKAACFEVDTDARERIRRDVDTGQWTPLKGIM